MTPEHLQPLLEKLAAEPKPLVVTLPPRAQMAEDVKARALAEKRPLTQEEQRILVLALPRKVRRKFKIRTTPIREELDALRSMAIPADESTSPEGRRCARNRAKASRRRRS